VRPDKHLTMIMGYSNLNAILDISRLVDDCSRCVQPIPRLSGRLLREAVGIPDELRKLLIEALPRVEIGLLELRMGMER
jgi:hypothetical protein